MCVVVHERRMLLHLVSAMSGICRMAGPIPERTLAPRSCARCGKRPGWRSKVGALVDEHLFGVLPLRLTRIVAYRTSGATQAFD